MAEKDTVPTTWEEVFKHKRFTELNDRAKKAETDLEKIKADLATAQTDLQAATGELKTANDKLKAAQEGQTDLEKLQTSLNELTQKFEGTQKELGAERFKNLQTKAAQEAGLPLSLASRLQGDSLEALVQDAKDNFVSHLKPATPGTPPVPPRNPPQPVFTADQLSNPEFVRKNRDKILADAAKD